ncbi:MAG: uroporphyrinogen-III C-methyltransferase, partial [Gammaproteobacteria bacterium]
MNEEKSLKPESVSEHSDAIETETAGKDDNEHIAATANLASNNGLPAVKTRRSFATGVAWLAVLLAMGGIFTSYYLWNELKRVEREQQRTASQLRGFSSQTTDRLAQAQGGAGQVKDQLSPLENRLSTVEQMLDEVREQSQGQQGVKQELSTLSQQFEEDLQRIERRQEDAQSVLKTLQQRQGSDLDTWRLAQVQFLLRVANESLQLQHDPTTATAALVSADNELKELGDPGYLPVREQLAKEIASLKALPWPDASGIAMALTGFSHQVRHLPVKGAKIPPPASGGAGAESSNLDDTIDWRQLPSIVWGSIRELVQVSRQDEQVGA